LPQNSVMAIAEDKKGFIWFGTRYGLSRYDGQHFRNFNNDPADSSTIADNQISAMLVDHQGTLWIAAYNQLCKYDQGKECFHQVPYKQGNLNGLNSPSVECFYEDREKNLWIGTRRGLNLAIDSKRNYFRNKFNWQGSFQTLAPYTKTIFQSSDGNLWIGTSQGLFRLSYSSGRITAYDVYVHDPKEPKSISSSHITAISEDNEHHLWVGTENDGVDIFSYEGGGLKRLMRLCIGKTDAIGNNIRQLAPDRQDRMWIGTQNGLFIYDTRHQRLTSYQHDPYQKGSLNSNSIRSIFHDQNGTAWVGTYHGGVNIAYQYATPFTVYQNDQHSRSISHDVISGMTEDPGGNLLIGTEGGGLNYFDRSTGIFTSYKNNPTDSASLSSNFIKCIYRDKTGNIWTGTSYNGDLNRFNPRTRKFYHYWIHQRDGQNFLNFDEVLTISEDTQGNVLIGTLLGLFKFNRKADGTFEHEPVKLNLSKDLINKSVHALLLDSKNNLWIGGRTGLHLLRAADGKIISFKKHGLPDSLHEHNINFIKEDSKGNIWIGTFYGGLYRYIGADNRFVSYTEKDGLPNNNVLGILEESAGRYWVSTDNGLSSFDLNQNIFKNYTVSDGLAGNKFNLNSLLKARNGEMFFGGNNGLTSFFPKAIQLNRYLGQIVFTSLRLAGDPVNINGADQILKQSITSTRELVFKHGQRLFSLEFALLNFIKPEKIAMLINLKAMRKNGILSVPLLLLTLICLSVDTPYLLKVRIMMDFGPDSRLPLLLPFCRPCGRHGGHIFATL
jgi:ligand-binding sensor domain-containing protein